MQHFIKEKEEAVRMKETLENVSTQWQNYERKIENKRELLSTYAG